jgi:hypothetical protein
MDGLSVAGQSAACCAAAAHQPFEGSAATAPLKGGAVVLRLASDLPENTQRNKVGSPTSPTSWQASSTQ